MRIRLVTVGQKMPAWVCVGYEEYAKRLPSECSLELIEIPLLKRTKNTDIARAMQKEAELMLSALQPQDFVITLEVGGKSWSTEFLSQQLCHWRQHGRAVALLVGGPEGLHASCLERAHARWSLSALTFPHPLVRIVIAEQLYRAWTILQNHPYHRA